MVRQKNARDPFLGLNAHIRRQAQGEIPAYCTLGEVLSVRPLTVRADGLDLDMEDMYIAEHLTAGWTERLTGLDWPLTARLVEKTFYGKHLCPFTGEEVKNEVTRPAETAEGRTCAAANAVHGALLKKGDLVLLLRSQDGQEYYLLERLVKIYDETVSVD